MTREDYIEALLCMADEASADLFVRNELGLERRDWDRMDIVTGPLSQTFVSPGERRIWLRPLEYAAALMAGDVDYPEWVKGNERS